MEKGKKNILLISVMQSWGGGEEFILKICKNLNDFKFFVATPEGEASEILKQKKIKVIIKNLLSKIYKLNNKWSLSSIIKSIYKIKVSAFSLSSIIYKNKIDLLIANGNFAALFSILPAIVMRKKLLVIQHLIYNENSFEAKLLKVIIKFSTKFVCVSNAVKENIILIIGDKYADKIEVIYNGIELPNLNSDINIHPVNKIRIGIVGSIIRIKGIDLVIDSLIDTISSNQNVNLFIYGNPNNQADSNKYHEELKTKIKENSLINKIHFMGYEYNKYNLYSSLDIIINFTIIPEAFPYSVLEAMAFSKIVIAPNIGGTVEIITNNVNGFLVKSNNLNSLKETLNFIINKFPSDSLNTIQQNARKTIENKFSLSMFTKNYASMLNSLIN